MNDEKFQFCHIKKTVVEIDALEKVFFDLANISIDSLYGPNKKYIIIESVLCLMESDWILCSMNVSVSTSFTNPYPHSKIDFFRIINILSEE